MKALPIPARVGLFVTCLVDLWRPSVGFAAARLLERARMQVVVPPQTCCGQPAYNAGRRTDAQAIARQVIDAFAGRDHVVVPSGSCAGMIRVHFPALLADDPHYGPRARELATRTFELVRYLHDVLGMRDFGQTAAATATFHDACSGLRELGTKREPRALLAGVAGLKLAEAANAETCCGFGGTFCVKYPEASTAIADAKIDGLRATGADVVISGDLGCLLHLEGRMRRRGIAIAARHVAEVLAGPDPAGREPE